MVDSLDTQLDSFFTWLDKNVPGGLANTFGAFGQQSLQPGTRNQYQTGLQQGIGSHIVVDANYFWKYTTRAYDFDTLFNTPITFPIEWRKSKIDGVSVRVNLANA